MTRTADEEVERKGKETESFYKNNKDSIRIVLGGTDLVELVSESVKLVKRPGGNGHVGRCPVCGFCDSLEVVPSRQYWHCWECGINGDAIEWVMLNLNVSARMAIHKLANRAGIKLMNKLVVVNKKQIRGVSV